MATSRRQLVSSTSNNSAEPRAKKRIKKEKESAFKSPSTRKSTTSEERRLQNRAAAARSRLRRQTIEMQKNQHIIALEETIKQQKDQIEELQNKINVLEANVSSSDDTVSSSPVLDVANDALPQPNSPTLLSLLADDITVPADNQSQSFATYVSSSHNHFFSSVYQSVDNVVVQPFSEQLYPLSQSAFCSRLNFFSRPSDVSLHCEPGNETLDFNFHV